MSLFLGNQPSPTNQTALLLQQLALFAYKSCAGRAVLSFAALAAVQDVLTYIGST